MLNLSNLRKLLLQVLALPGLHTAVLFTPSGQLVSYVSEPSKPKDHVRVVVGLSTEIWKETKELDMGRVDCEVSAKVLFNPYRVKLALFTDRTTPGIACRTASHRVNRQFQ